MHIEIGNELVVAATNFVDLMGNSQVSHGPRGDQ